jgi:phosphatidylserine synthase
MNATMGISAIVLAQNGRFHLSMVLLVFAAVFDKLDGAAARKLGLIEEPTPGVRHITLGMILDDVADLISFCIAPAAIGAAYLPGDQGFWVLVLYAVLGLARLIYFTLDTKATPGYFKGLPSPAAALFVGGIIHFAEVMDKSGELAGNYVVALFLVTGLLMNLYFVKFIHFGQLLGRSKTMTRIMTVIILVSIFLKPALGLITILIMVAYLLSPLYMKKPQPKVEAPA